jgi:hypothetical protein
MTRSLTTWQWQTITSLPARSRQRYRSYVGKHALRAPGRVKVPAARKFGAGAGVQ